MWMAGGLLGCATLAVGGRAGAEVYPVSSIEQARVAVSLRAIQGNVVVDVFRIGFPDSAQTVTPLADDLDVAFAPGVSISADLVFGIDFADQPVVFQSEIGVPAVPLVLEFDSLAYSWPATGDAWEELVGVPTGARPPSMESTITGTLSLGTSTLPFSLVVGCAPINNCMQNAEVEVLLDSAALRWQIPPIPASTPTATLQPIGMLDGVDFELDVVGVWNAIEFVPEPASTPIAAILALLALRPPRSNQRGVRSAGIGPQSCLQHHSPSTAR